MKRDLLRQACWLCTSITIAIGLGSTAAAKWILPSFAEVVDSSARIARVQIVDNQPVGEDDGNATELCGFRYTAKVTEEFKGGGEEFSFVSRSSDDFVGTDRDYLVFAFRHPKGEAARILSYSSRQDTNESLELKRAQCGFSGSEFHVLDWPQTMIPFESTGINELSEDSLLVDRINPFSGLDIEIKEVERSGKKLGLINWRTARELLRKQLSGEDVPLRR